MTKLRRLQPGEVPTRKAALTIARRLGCTVETVARTGEVRIVSPNGDRVTLNNRRTDASRALIHLLRDAESGPTGANPARPQSEGYPAPARQRKGSR